MSSLGNLWWRGLIIVVAGVFGTLAADLVLFPVAVILAPFHFLLRPFAGGAVAGLLAFWVGEWLSADGSRGRIRAIVGAAVVAAVVYDLAFGAIALFFGGAPVGGSELAAWTVGIASTQPAHALVVGVAAGLATLTLRKRAANVDRIVT